MAPNSDNVPFEFSAKTRQKDWETLKNNSTQILPAVILGGGIVGAGALREFSLQGISGCYLFEKNDFASGTSGASSKLIHAGIRYLEQAWERLKELKFRQAWENFVFVLKASQERRILGEMVPHLVKPKPIYLVIGESDSRSLFSVFCGVWFYYLIQIFQGQFFRPPKTVFRKEALRWIAPEVDSKKVRALFSFWDSETDDARLVIENLQNAVQNGGHALNYVELIKFEQENEFVRCHLLNKENGESIEVRAYVLINATGPFVDNVIGLEPGAKLANCKWVDRVAGGHINVYPAITSESYYLTANDNRLVFVLKRNEDGLIYSRIGTTERTLSAKESTDHPYPTPTEIDYLINTAKEFFPKAEISEKTLISVDEGIRPLCSQEASSEFQKSREHRILQDKRVVHVIGVKLTDFRRVSEELFNEISWNRWGVDINNSGKVAQNQMLRTENLDSLYAESNIQDVISKTMPIHWDDVVLRRRGLLPQVWAKQDQEKLAQEFSEMAQIFGWDENRQQTERARFTSYIPK